MKARREILMGAAVLAVNAVVMSVELLAARILFPRYGNTVFTWSAVISMVVAGLFLGYMAGGIAAERSKNRIALAGAELLASGLLVMAVPWLCDGLLLRPSAAGAIYPPLLACFAVFGLPAAALASLPPAAVGVWVESGRGASLSAGVVSALSAFGSILGTLGTTFYLIPAFGARSLFVAYGACLGLLAAGLWLCARASFGPGRAAVMALAYAAGLFLASRAASRPAPSAMPRPLYSRDSRYQLIRVFEYGKGPELTRLLMLDSTQEGAMRLEAKELVFDYTRAYRLLVNALAGESSARVLFIGGGAYAMPIRTASELPRAEVLVAEVDPEVKEVGERFFGAAETPNLKTLVMDGRRALFGREGSYDGIFIDAYQGVMAIPFHLTTREFFEEVRSSLQPGGLVALNLIGDVTEREGLLCSVTRTLEAVFPRVDLHPVRDLSPGTQNVIIVAQAQAPGPGFLEGTGLSQALSSKSLACVACPLLTDDFAPVEYLVARYLRPEREAP